MGLSRGTAMGCVGPGWANLVREFYDEVERNHKDQGVTVVQVKEKFGGLRIYYYSGNEFLEGFAWALEALSFSICEYCGQAGFPRGDLGWIKTLCDSCYKEKLNDAVHIPARTENN